METTARPLLCSVSSAQAGEDMIGTVWAPKAMALVEAPLPWTADPASYFGADLLKLRARAWKERRFELGIVALAPDRRYDSAGGRRVVWHRRSTSELAGYERMEFVVRGRDVAPLLAGLIGLTDDAARFMRHRAEGPASRDLVMCTHGTVDACCGKLGYPAFQQLQEIAAGTNVRVWRGSHFGGHRFAPTVLDMPEGRYWGRLDDDAMRELVHRDGDAARMRDHYRGWAGAATPALAVVERELLARFGWRWTQFEVEGEVLSTDADSQCARVRIAYRDPFTGDAGAFHAKVEASGDVMVGGCGVGEAAATRQYRIAHLTRQLSHVAATVPV